MFRKIQLLTLLLVLALVLAACPAATPAPAEEPAAEEEAPAEEAEEPAAEEAPAEEAEEPAEEEAPAEEVAGELETITVGVLVPLTGALSEFGTPFQQAAELAQMHLETAGCPAEIIVGDSETSAIPAVERARQLIEVEGVDALVGAASSGVTIPVAESVSIPNQVPQISYASTSPLITNLPADEGQDFLFRTTPSDALQGIVLADLARALGYENAASLYVNNPYGQGLNDVFAENFETAGGTMVAGVAIPEEPQPTYVAELRQSAEEGAEVLLALAYPGQATVYIREALEGDFFTDFLFVDGTKSQDIPETVGNEAVEGMYGTAPGSVETPSLEIFNTTYEEQFGQVPPQPFMTNVYDAVVIAALAGCEAQIAGEGLSGVSVRDHLRSVAGPDGEIVGAGPDELTRAMDLIRNGEAINYEGAAGAQDFDESGDVVTPIEIWQYQDGVPTTVTLANPGEEIDLGE